MENNVQNPEDYKNVELVVSWSPLSNTHSQASFWFLNLNDVCLIINTEGRSWWSDESRQICWCQYRHIQTDLFPGTSYPYRSFSRNQWHSFHCLQALRGDCLNVTGERLIFPVNIRVSELWAFSRVPRRPFCFSVLRGVLDAPDVLIALMFLWPNCVHIVWAALITAFSC